MCCFIAWELGSNYVIVSGCVAVKISARAAASRKFNWDCIWFQTVHSQTSKLLLILCEVILHGPPSRTWRLYHWNTTWLFSANMMINFRCPLDRDMCSNIEKKNKAQCSPHYCWALSNQFMVLIDWKSRPFTWRRENSSYSKDCLVRWGNFSGTLTEIEKLVLSKSWLW